MKKIKWLISTHYGRLLLATMLVVAGGLIMQHSEDKWNIGAASMTLGLITMGVYFIVMMYFAITGTISDNKK